MLDLSIIMQPVIISREITHNLKCSNNSRYQTFKYKIRDKVVTTTFMVVHSYKTRSRKMDQLRIARILRLSKWARTISVTRWTGLLLETKCRVIIVVRKHLLGRTLKTSKLAISQITTSEASTSRKVEIKIYFPTITLRVSHNKIYSKYQFLVVLRYKMLKWLKHIKGVVEWPRMASKLKILSQWVPKWGPTTF